MKNRTNKNVGTEGAEAGGYVKAAPPLRGVSAEFEVGVIDALW
jgi:hypothetical protein